MKRVIGQFTTPYGPCHFVMVKPSNITVFLGNKDMKYITAFRVDYTGQISFKRNEKRWGETPGTIAIQRLDGLPINFSSNGFEKFRKSLLQSWVKYITLPRNQGILILAAYANLANERNKLEEAITEAQQRLAAVTSVLTQWENLKGPLYAATISELETLTYDINTVRLRSD